MRRSVSAKPQEGQGHIDRLKCEFAKALEFHISKKYTNCEISSIACISADLIFHLKMPHESRSGKLVAAAHWFRARLGGGQMMPAETPTNLTFSRAIFEVSLNDIVTRWSVAFPPDAQGEPQLQCEPSIDLLEPKVVSRKNPGDPGFYSN